MSRSFVDVLKVIEENKIEVVEFKMIDSAGRTRTIAIPAKSLTMELVQNGISVDSVRGVCVEEGKGDAIFVPEFDCISVDPFAVYPKMTISGRLQSINMFPQTPVYAEPYAQKPAPKGSKGDRITSLIFSIVSLYFGVNAAVIAAIAAFFAVLFWWAYGLGILYGAIFGFFALIYTIVAIVFGALGKGRCKKCERSTGMATAGLVLGIVSCAILLIPIILAALVVLLFVLLLVVYFVIMIVLIFVYVLLILFVACLGA